MKKINKLILISAFLLGMSSCTELLVAEKHIQEKQQIPENAQVLVTFGVPTEVKTKALEEKPVITSMHVFVFDHDGLLVEAKKAICGKVTENSSSLDNLHVQYWSVLLSMSGELRRLHFVANLEEETTSEDYVPYSIPTSGDEVSLIASLKTTGGKDAYWQYKKLENGITAYVYDGTGTYKYVDSDGSTKTITLGVTQGYKDFHVEGDSYWYMDENDKKVTVNKGDYITVAGKKVIDGYDILFASENTSATVSLVPMIRNFTCIKLTSSWQGFSLVQAALVNTPVAGYVAPYNDKKNEFVQAYINAKLPTDLVSTTIRSDNYSAVIPPITDLEHGIVNGINKNYPTKFYPAKDDRAVYLYMYERGIPSDNPTCILLQGTRNGSTKWYKIEITGEDGLYFPFFRDFTYTVDIKSIEGTEGFTDPIDAFNASPIGDFSSSLETKTLTQIDDGKGLNLCVQYIDETYMGPLAEEGDTPVTLTLKYKFFYTTGNTITSLNHKVSFDILHPYGSDTPAAVTSVTKGNSDDAEGWRTATITLAGVGQIVKMSDVQVIGTAVPADFPSGVTGYNKTLSRDVTYRVLQYKNIGLKAEYVGTGSNAAVNAAGKTVRLTIQLPPNLGRRLFPMTFMIESKDNNLSSNDLSVETGESTFTNKTDNTFYFLKTIEYTDYFVNNSYVTDFPCTFTTTKQTSSNNPVTKIRVTDKAGKFTSQEVDLLLTNVVAQ